MVATTVFGHVEGARTMLGSECVSAAAGAQILEIIVAGEIDTGV